MTVSDEEMDGYLKAGLTDEIRKAAARDSGLVARGWRNGTVPWIKSAILFDTYRQTIPVLLELGADINASKKDQPLDDAIKSAVTSSDVEKLRFLLEH
ncbi:MAG: hypothetical protein ACTHK7_13780, partial [Aureliella sp.]